MRGLSIYRGYLRDKREAARKVQNDQRGERIREKDRERQRKRERSLANNDFHMLTARREHDKGPHIQPAVVQTRWFRHKYLAVKREEKKKRKRKEKYKDKGRLPQFDRKRKRRGGRKCEPVEGKPPRNGKCFFSWGTVHNIPLLDGLVFNTHTAYTHRRTHCPLVKKSKRTCVYVLESSRCPKGHQRYMNSSICQLLSTRLRLTHICQQRQRWRKDDLLFFNWQDRVMSSWLICCDTILTRLQKIEFDWVIWNSFWILKRLRIEWNRSERLGLR